MLLVPPVSRSWSALFLILTLAYAIEARAVSANITSLPSTTFIVSVPTNTSPPDAAACYDIRYCRTLEGLVQSCVVTILACVWFAVHRNIPAPKVDRPHRSNPLANAAMLVWDKILDQRQAAIVFVAALLAPEWILAWALRQFLVARSLTENLEKARIYALQRREAKLSEGSQTEEPRESTDDHTDTETLAGSSGISTRSEHVQLLKRQSKSPDDVASMKCEKPCSLHCSMDLHASEPDQVTMARRVAKDTERWRTAHAFFIIMGGFHFYSETGPLYPLGPETVVGLVSRGHLVPPTSSELANQSKGDALSKGVAILQTLWFVMQCIARRAEGLPLTSLEVMTLAYTVITVAMYAVWWDKPLNVSCAVRVPKEDVAEAEAAEYGSFWDQIANYVIGGQDECVDLRRCARVPTFWAGDRDDDYTSIADIIALVAAMVFGAVHCIAWSYHFPSPFELQLWRVSAIAIIAVPAALGTVVVLAFIIQLSEKATEIMFIALGRIELSQRSALATARHAAINPALQCFLLL
ncbi:hypothetical protein HWV62_235 [Athelia sp. TMB]|nr:hypothetical protein HWV62_235 [Athelia sp. TMB]